VARAIELLQQGRNEELWQMCCGYLDLDIEQFMAIQKRLLLEQLELLNRSQLGEKIMRGFKPRTVEEFREQVPLTTYADYCPELLEKREDILPAQPVSWVHTSGRSGEYPCKWVPMTQAYSQDGQPGREVLNDIIGNSGILRPSRAGRDDDGFYFLSPYLAQSNFVIAVNYQFLSQFPQIFI